jgi:hypothetical protein
VVRPDFAVPIAAVMAIAACAPRLCENTVSQSSVPGDPASAQPQTAFDRFRAHGKHQHANRFSEREAFAD